MIGKTLLTFLGRERTSLGIVSIAFNGREFVEVDGVTPIAVERERTSLGIVSIVAPKVEILWKLMALCR